MTDDQFNKEGIIKFIKDSIENKIPFEIFSQQPFPIKHFSRKITGEFFKQFLDEPENQLLFAYSKNCHGCKKFFPAFEELCKESLQETLNFKATFNRIDNDTDQSPLKDYFWSTPKIQVYRKNGLNPRHVFNFEGKILNKQIMKDFFELSLRYNIVNSTQEFFQ